MELRVIGEVLLGVLLSADVIILFLNLELSDFGCIALLFVEFDFNHVQEDRKNFVVNITDIY